jgi:hypothetical protein
MFRGVCADPGGGPDYGGSPDPALLASLGIRRVRIISRPGLEWYVDACWEHNIVVRAVVEDGFYCPADEHMILNEPNLRGLPARDFAEQLKIHRSERDANYPGRVLIAGGLADNPAAGLDAADYLAQVKRYGGLNGLQGVAIHYPASASRMVAFKNSAIGLPIHVDEWNPDGDPRQVSDYLAYVLRPYARTADLFCVQDGMRDPGWSFDMGLFTTDWKPKPLLRHLLSLT